MGKTETGAVWLDNKFLSSYDYWQFWRNTDDRDVLKFINMFTELEIEVIKKIEKKDINNLKITLANNATELLHGKEASQNAETTAKKTFKENSTGDGLPSITIKKNKILENINIIDLVLLSKLESSKSEIRRLIRGNGIKINNTTVQDEKFIINKKNLIENKFLKLSIGKKKHIKINFD